MFLLNLIEHSLLIYLLTQSMFDSWLTFLFLVKCWSFQLILFKTCLCNLCADANSSGIATISVSSQ